MFFSYHKTNNVAVFVIIFVCLLYICKVISINNNEHDYQEMSITGDQDFSTSRVVEDTVWPIQQFSSTLYLLFSPQELHFYSYLCARQWLSVSVRNMHSDRSIRILSASSTDHQFQPLLLKSFYLGPAETTTFQVSYTPKYEGRYSADMILRTSDGDIKYKLVGNSSDAIYNLKPLTYRLTLGNPFWRIPITLRNPHNETMNILKVSSHNQFAPLIDLPTVTQLQQNYTWAVESNQTKEVFSLIIRTDSLGEEHGCIDIETNLLTLCIFVTVKIVDSGLKPVPDRLDFGTILVGEQRTIELSVSNTDKHDLLVTSISSIPKIHGLDIVPVQLPLLVPAGDDTQAGVIAFITYTSKESGTFEGYVQVMTNHPNSSKAFVEIPFKASVLRGGVGFDSHASIVYIPDEEIDAIERPLSLTNHYNAPVTITESILNNCSNFVEIQHFAAMAVAESLGVWPQLVLKVHVNLLKASLVELPTKCALIVYTNMSTHTIPIYILKGSIQLNFLNEVNVLKKNSTRDDIEYKINMGSIWSGESKPLYLVATNPNSISAALTWSLNNESVPYCICFEASWPSDDSRVNIERASQLTHIIVPKTYSASLNDSPHSCECVNHFDHKNNNKSKEAVPRMTEVFPNYSNLYSIVYPSRAAACSVKGTACALSLKLNSPNRRFSLTLEFVPESRRCLNMLTPTDDYSRYRTAVIGQIRTFQGYIAREGLNGCTPVSLQKILPSNSSVLYFNNVEVPKSLSADAVESSTVLWKGQFIDHGFWVDQNRRSFWQHSLYLVRALNASVRMDDLVQRLIRMEPSSILIQSWLQTVSTASATSLRQFQMNVITFKNALRDVRAAWSRHFPTAVSFSSTLEVTTKEYLSKHDIPVSIRIDSPLSVFPSKYQHVLDPVLFQLSWVFVQIANPFAFPISVTLMTNDIISIKDKDISIRDDSLTRDRELLTSVFSKSLSRKWRDKVGCSDDISGKSTQSICDKKVFSFDQDTGKSRVSSNLPQHRLVQALHVFTNNDSKVSDEMREDIASIDSKFVDKSQALFIALFDSDPQVAGLSSDASILHHLAVGETAFLGPVFIIPPLKKCKDMKKCIFSPTLSELKQLQNNFASLSIVNNYTGLEVLQISRSMIVPRLSLTSILVNSSIESLVEEVYSPAMNKLPLHEIEEVSIAGANVEGKLPVSARFFNNGTKPVVIKEVIVAGKSCQRSLIQSLGSSTHSLCAQLPISVAPNSSIVLQLISSASCVLVKQLVPVSLLLSSGIDSEPEAVEFTERLLLELRLSENSVPVCEESPDHALSSNGLISLLFAFICVVCSIYCLTRAALIVRPLVLRIYPAFDRATFREPAIRAVESVEENVEPVAAVIEENIMQARLALQPPHDISYTSSMPTTKTASRTDLALDWRLSTSLNADNKSPPRIHDEYEISQDVVDLEPPSPEAGDLWQQMNISPAKGSITVQNSSEFASAALVSHSVFSDADAALSLNTIPELTALEEISDKQSTSAFNTDSDNSGTHAHVPSPEKRVLPPPLHLPTLQPPPGLSIRKAQKDNNALELGSDKTCQFGVNSPPYAHVTSGLEHSSLSNISEIRQYNLSNVSDQSFDRMIGRININQYVSQPNIDLASIFGDSLNSQTMPYEDTMSARSGPTSPLSPPFRLQTSVAQRQHHQSRQTHILDNQYRTTDPPAGHNTRRLSGADRSSSYPPVQSSMPVSKSNSLEEDPAMSEWLNNVLNDYLK